jgi:hypothetical protein
MTNDEGGRRSVRLHANGLNEIQMDWRKKPRERLDGNNLNTNSTHLEITTSRGNLLHRIEVDIGTFTHGDNRLYYR